MRIYAPPRTFKGRKDRRYQHPTLTNSPSPASAPVSIASPRPLVPSNVRNTQGRIGSFRGRGSGRGWLRRTGLRSARQREKVVNTLRKRRGSRENGEKDGDERTDLLDLRIYAVDGAEPRPGEGRSILEVKRRGLLVCWVFIYRAYHNREPTPHTVSISSRLSQRKTKNEDPLSMCEHRTPPIQQIIDAELDPVLNNPAEGTIMVVCDVVD